MNTNVTSLMLALALTGCGLIKVNGGAADPAASPAEQTTAESSAAGPGSTQPSEPTGGEKKQSKGDLQCESSFVGELQSKGAIERNGELHVATAIDGFSADGLKKAVTQCYEGYGETPSAEVLARADGAMKEQREAALAAAPKWEMPEAAASDATLEQAIKKDFLEKHPGSEIKRVFMTSGWQTNKEGLVVRNRYKDAVVVMGVKGTDICLRVPANAAQAANGGGFDSKLAHDVFDVGTVVRCK